MQQAATSRFPAEWEPHSRTWLFWPADPEKWLYGSEAEHEDVIAAFVAVGRAILEDEELAVAGPPSAEPLVRKVLGAGVHFLPLDLDDAWARDAAPSFVQTPGGGLAGVDWVFNGWGGRFVPHDRDARAAEQILAALGLPRIASPLIAEGGAIHGDGAGTVYVTRPVLLHPGRNASRGEAWCEEQLRGALGANRVVWLPSGYPGDDTGGHVDVVLLPAPGNRVLLAAAEDGDPAAAAFRANRDFFSALPASGRAEVVSLPVPPPSDRRVRSPEGVILVPYSYCNAAITNGAVLAPVFRSAVADDRAAGILAESFPSRRILPVDARALYRGGGGIHCINQQQPARAREKRGG